MNGGAKLNKETMFDNYLRENDMNFFDKLPRDNDDEVLYRSNYTISGNNVIFLISLDSSLYTLLQCRLMKLNNPLKREKMLYLLNDLNSNYKANKFVLTENDFVDFTVPFISTDDEFNPELVMSLTHNILKMLDDDYAKLMRVNWS